MNEQELERCKFATNILYQFVTSTDARLKYGASQRQKMMDSLSKGEKVEPTYRSEWILKSADEVIRTLVKSSERFNNTYFNDMISIEDMKDVFTSAIKRLNNAIKKKKS